MIEECVKEDFPCRCGTASMMGVTVCIGAANGQHHAKQYKYPLHISRLLSGLHEPQVVGVGHLLDRFAAVGE